jgi:hypothetical protein
MADLGDGDLKVKFAKAKSTLEKIRPETRLKWLEARRFELADKIQGKQREIDLIEKVRLNDLRVEVEALKTDLDIFDQIQTEIMANRGLPYFESDE